MSLTLKQARRMVAKSRRRVWRFCRFTGAAVTFNGRVIARTGLAAVLIEVQAIGGPPKLRRAAGKLADELRVRRHALHALEQAHQDRAWARFHEAREAANAR
jgi:hypothetical protein